MSAALGQPGVTRRSRLRHDARAMVHFDVLGNSLSLMGTTIVTSVLGFVYWWVVARSFPAQSVGAASAAIAALTLLSTIGVFGFGTMLIGELARFPERVRSLLPTTLSLACALSAALAVVFVILARWSGSGLSHSFSSPVTAALFVVGVAMTAALLVFDEAAIGLRIAHVQLYRNAVFSAAKLVLVLALGAFAGLRDDVGLLVTWLLGLALSTVVILPVARRRGIPLVGPLRRSGLSGVGKLAVDHNVLNLAITIPRMAGPVVVAATLPGAPTAAFYAAWMVAGFLYLVPTHLSTALYAVAAGDVKALRDRLRTAMFVCAAVGCVLVPAVVWFAEPIMRSFGHDYARLASGCLAWLALQYGLQVVKQMYAAVARVHGCIRLAGRVAGLACVAELAAVFLGARFGSLTTAAAAVGVVLAVECVVMAPRVVTAMRSSVEGQEQQ